MQLELPPPARASGRTFASEDEPRLRPGKMKRILCKLPPRSTSEMLKFAPLLAALLLVALAAASLAGGAPPPPSPQPSTRAPAGQRQGENATLQEANPPNANQEPLEQQATELRPSTTSNGTQEHLEDLIAIGRVGLAAGGGQTDGPLSAEQSREQIERASALALRHSSALLNKERSASESNGRLVDRIAEVPADDTGHHQQVGSHRPSHTTESKLDYIIEFMRQNKLTKFCDLLTHPSGRVRDLIKRLDGMPKFTLFVPTNEALLLMPSAQLEAIAESPDETRQFLMAHATGELVVPKLSDPTVGNSLAALTSKYTPGGALNRWSSGRQLDKIALLGQQSPAQPAASLVYSLAGAPLRIITTPVLVPAGSQAGNLTDSQPPPPASTRLELIVNGANVLSGHSHALQEPNNTNVTYAIVHLIDRTLYPAPRASVYERIQQVAPRFAKLLQASTDFKLLDELKSNSRRLTTAFVPSDDAFRTIPSKLLDQLDTNRTFLQQFVRSHLVDGLFYSGQLASPLSGSPPLGNLSSTIQQQLQQQQQPQIPRLLTALSGTDLEFEAKVLQSRQLILVNSIPILDQDQVALNGVVHVIVRPLFERSLLDDACKCESKLQPDNSTADWLRRKGIELGAESPLGESQPGQASRPNPLDNSLEGPSTNQFQAPSQQQNSANRQRLSSTSLSNWFRNVSPARGQPATGSANSLELEREESQLVSSDSSGRGSSSVQLSNQQDDRQGPQPLVAMLDENNRLVIRAQRSDNQMLVARNNRDFYRPSAAPANLVLQESSQFEGDQQPLGRRRADHQQTSSTQSNATLRSLEPDQRGTWTNGQVRPPGPEVAPTATPTGGPTDAAFEVERYKVVMNATTRQRLREQGQRTHADQTGGLIMSSSLREQNQQPQDQSRAAHLFTYDQPLATPPSASPAGSRLWTYSTATAAAAAAPSSNASQPSGIQPLQDQVGSSASTQRHQRLLKFQAEDARDPQVAHQQQVVAKHRQALAGKTVAPPLGNFAGCAFYDAECKRLQLSGKFVRLPARHATNKQAQQQQQPQVVTMATLPLQQQQQQANRSILIGELNKQTSPVLINNYAPAPPTTPSSSFDSTFGETTESSLAASASAGHSPRFSTPLSVIKPRPVPQPPALPKNYLSFSPPGGGGPRVSPLNLPLPPWSEDEHKQQVAGGTLNHNLLQNQNQNQNQRQQTAQVSSQISFGQQVGGSNWRAQEVSDLARISHQLASKLPAQQTNFSLNQQQSSITLRAQNQQQQQQQQAPQQVLLIPVKMLQDSNISLASSRLRLAANQSRPIYFAQQGTPTAGGSDQGARPQAPPARLTTTFSANSQYFTPTVQPPATPSQVTLGRLTNFTALENVPLDGFDASSSSSAGKQQVSSSFFVQRPATKQSSGTKPETPVAYLVSQQPTKSFASFQNDSTTSGLRGAIKQARKIVRLQSSPSFQQEQELGFSSNLPGGDISVTSAKLSAAVRPTFGASANYSSSPSSGALAVQASNQAPDVSGLTFAATPTPSSASQSADFFQNRTIAEIMDDSGLRIDGQQVTFNRLRECLDKADLSNLITQQGSSLTIFMPTDMAFQRLVQAQALMQQRNSRASSSSATTMARITDRRNLLPLIARVGSIRGASDPLALAATSLDDGLAPSSSPARLQDLSAGQDLSSSTSSLGQRLTLDCSTQQVRQLLLDHLSGQLITPKQLQADSILNSLSGKRLLLSSVPSKKIVVVDGQPVIAATRAKNGMVYVVNKFLNMTNQTPTVVDLLESQPNLKTFQSYLAFSSLTDRLKRETGPITILAPTNEAFEQLSSAARQLLNSDPAAMMDILRGHIIEGAQFGKLVSMRNRFKTMNSDHFIEARVIKPNIYQLDNQMTSMKLVGTSGNGVVNSIDRLIVPPWLRVSPGGRAQQPTGGNSPTLGRSILELEDPTNSLLPPPPPSSSATTASLVNRQPHVNLPSLNNQPLRFEQPDARLAPPTSNSFALAGSTSAPESAAADSFDVPPSPSLSSSFDTGDQASFPRFPAGNQTASATPPAGGRLSQPSSLSNLGGPTNSTTSSSTTTTKNMLLIEKLAGLMKARKFVKYLFRSRLNELLKPDMNYVILVPTDQAIERLPKQIIDMLDRDPDRLSDLVNFHVLDTTFEYINTIPDGQTLNTLNEKDILFNWHRNNTILTASGAVVLGGIQEENIALLIVDRVLYPTPGDLLSIVTKSPILSNFTQLIKNAGLERQLSLAGPFTLFAPSDFAFNQLDKRDLEFLQQNRETARRFLLRHLSQPAVFTSSIALSNSTLSKPPPAPQVNPVLTITNSLGEDLALKQKNDYFSVNDVNFSYADVAATNGVVHVIDGLL